MHTEVWYKVEPGEWPHLGWKWPDPTVLPCSVTAIWRCRSRRLPDDHSPWDGWEVPQAVHLEDDAATEKKDEQEGGEVVNMEVEEGRRGRRGERG